jgi:hypothetical protein
MNYTITSEQIEQALKAVNLGLSEIQDIRDHEYFCLVDARGMLQSLPRLLDQPEQSATFAPITADDVTDEMYKKYTHLCFADRLSERAFIAEVTNVVVQNRKTK